MLLDRPTKTFFAVFSLVATIMLAVNYAIQELPLEDWGLAGLLLIFSAAMWIWLWREDVETEAKALATQEQAAVPTTQEWVVSPTPAATEPDASESAVAEPAPVEEAAEPDASESTTAESAPTEEATEPDDLTRVEGIGPKYRDALVEAGITTFVALAATNLETIEAAADAAGMRKSASMVTWAEQAKLAATGDWAGLEKLQEELTGGRRD